MDNDRPSVPDRARLPVLPECPRCFGNGVGTRGTGAWIDCVICGGTGRVVDRAKAVQRLAELREDETRSDL